MMKTLSFIEKIKLLTVEDQLYLSGYIDKTLNDYQYPPAYLKEKLHQQKRNLMKMKGVKQ